ncbi:unnamed protein product [Adineta steineri]|uniref:Uncharacterized protein n=1 Tax=Adineta steineri TaxID=433720 RepID=A0A815Q873_9BILA|nr:unnamed protein product [Adineta steineri]CAF1459491.1 unnamed protein product [Adineta steineri]
MSVSMQLVLNYILPVKTIGNLWTPQLVHNFILQTIASAVILFLCLWGMIIFANIIRFIATCSIDLWVSSNNADQRNTIGMCIRRAFTTDFKTICIGPQSQTAFLVESRMREFRKRVKVLIYSYTRYCQTFKMILGLMNEWDFEYEALTKQPFAQASRKALKTTHPDHYASLTSAWDTLHRKELVTSDNSNNI